MSVKFRSLAVAGVMVASFATLGTSVAFASTPTPNPTFTRPVPTPTNPVVNPLSCDNVRGGPITFAPTANPSDEVSPTDGLSSQPDFRTLQPTGQPTDHRTPPPVVNPLTRCTPEQFVVQQTSVGNVVVQNRVIANGPVAGTGSDDLGVSTNTFSRFRLPGLLRRVNVLHTGVGFPSVNLPLCVASLNQLGVWRFNGGPAGSVFRNSIGNGRFLLTGQWVFPTVRGVCSLSLIRGNPLLQNRYQPTYQNIQVWATGLARR